MGGAFFSRKYRLKAFCKAKPLPHLRQTVPTVRRTNTVGRTVFAPFWFRDVEFSTSASFLSDYLNQ